MSAFGAFQSLSKIPNLFFDMLQQSENQIDVDVQ
jgi:hypothetical protein